MKDRKESHFRDIVGQGQDLGKAQSTGSRWLTKLAPKWLMRMPDGVPDQERKVYFARLAVPIIGLTAHFLLLLMFVIIELPSMIWLNLASVLIFMGAAAVVRSGRHHLGTAISTFEVAIHIPLATFLLGLNTGYLIFNYLVAMAAALTYRRERRERRTILTYAFASSAIVTAMTYHQGAVIELAQWKQNVIFCVVAASTYVALVLFASYFVNLTEQAERRVEQELERSERLLLNVLPAEVAERLKTSPTTIADRYGSVTVLFADIVGFTSLAAYAPGEELVAMLNDIFSAFDRIAEKYNLEKIKTIGDAYMLVGGLPRPMRDHAVKVVQMALEMGEAMEAFRAKTKSNIQIRIGIHSGPVVAGVIGEKKFAYDLWGDTVNIASRLESHGLPGEVQISEDTRDLLGEAFNLIERGGIELKGKGRMRTWFVKKAKPATATNTESSIQRAG